MSDTSTIKGFSRPWKTFDDIVVGDQIQGYGRTITESEIVMITALTTGFHQQLHVNAEWVRTHTQFSGVILPGPIIVSYAVGLLSATLVYSGITIAFLGLDQVRAKAPIYAGDTITAYATINSKRLSSDPAKGVVEMDISVRKQDQSVALTFLYTLLVQTGKEKAEE